MSKYLYRILLTLVAFALAANALAGGVADISRSYGPFELGMSDARFAKLTGIEPSHCPICLDKERFVALSEQQLLRQGIDEKNPNGVDFFFLDGQLYLISRTPDTDSIHHLREEISAIFGTPGVYATAPNGISSLDWEDNETLISINFSETSKEIFSLSVKDKKIARERDKRETVMLESAASTH